MAAQQAPHPYGAPYGAPYGQPVPPYGTAGAFGPAAYPTNAAPSYAPTAFNPSGVTPSPFRSAGAAYDDDMSSSESSSLHGGARRLNSKAKAKAAIWRNQVMAYRAAHEGMSLKEAMIKMSQLRKKASRKSRR